MSREQVAVALAVDAIACATMVALIVRKRWRLCWSFAAYLAVVVTYNLSVVLWPERFFKAWFWILGHGAFDALRVALTLELVWRVFRKESSPAAAPAFVALAGLIIVAPGMQMVGGRGLNAWEWPWMIHTTVLIMVATLVVARRRRTRMDPFHRALLAGFASYLTVFAVMPAVLGRPQPAWLAACEPIAFLSLLCFLAWSAWRPVVSTGPSGPSPAAVLPGGPDGSAGRTHLRRWVLLPTRAGWSARSG
jgi:hypothetical protein